jgi:3-hydroxyisobutyrate dehydrogenase-like beta-hydroxyacid dehydrogenase
MKTAVLGMGLMGRAIARRLSDTGHDITAWSRSFNSIEQASSIGIECDTKLDSVVQQADTLIIMLSDYPAIESTLIERARPGSLHNLDVIQMATISPSQSIELARSVKRLGGNYLEAPVLGSIPQVQDGSLIIMCGGEAEVFSRQRHLLDILGSEIHLVGKAGQGAALKLAMNQLIAMLTTAFAHSLGFVRQHQVDEGLFMDLLRKSALYAPTFDKKLLNMQSGQYKSANFSLKHLLKDQRLFCDSFTSAQPAICQAVIQMLHGGVRQGHGDLDYSVIFDLVNPPPTESREP